MNAPAATIVAASASVCCCWLVCARGSGRKSTGEGPAGNSPAEIERLRQTVARAERALQPRDGLLDAPKLQEPPPPAGSSSIEPNSRGSTPAWLSRSTLLLGEGAMGRLANARVLLVGLGGVGGYTAEFLARAGIGYMTIVDGDTVDQTNRNRQLVALTSTEGQPKSTVLAERLRDINPSCHVTARQEFVPADPAQVDALVASEPFDFVVDAIDSLQPKVLVCPIRLLI